MLVWALPSHSRGKGEAFPTRFFSEGEPTMKTMIWSLAALFGVGMVLSGGSARAADEPKVGDKAPDFTLKASDGKTYSLADFKGKKGVVIAWFPKAFTGGCTAECKSFKANSDSLKSTNVAYF